MTLSLASPAYGMETGVTDGKEETRILIFGMLCVDGSLLLSEMNGTGSEDNDEVNVTHWKDVMMTRGECVVEEGSIGAVAIETLKWRTPERRARKGPSPCRVCNEEDLVSLATRCFSGHISTLTFVYSFVRPFRSFTTHCVLLLLLVLDSPEPTSTHSFVLRHTPSSSVSPFVPYMYVLQPPSVSNSAFSRFTLH